MGCCMSKKDPSLSTPLAPIQPTDPSKPDDFVVRVENKKKVVVVEVERAVKNKVEIKQKEVQQQQDAEEEKSGDKVAVRSEHRKSNDKRPEANCPSGSNGSVPCGLNRPISPSPASDNGAKAGIGSNKLGIGAAARTSSCTKEEVDAILIQCGRLSRSSSGKGTMSCENRSGKKRSSHDFDSDNLCGLEDPKMRSDGQLDVEDGLDDDDDEGRMRRECRGGSQRRRTPSRGSREMESQHRRSANGNRRRVSRSPGRRSENNGVTNGGSTGTDNIGPGKMVPVPATVSSLSNESEGGIAKAEEAMANVSAKKIARKRNGGEGGVAMSKGTASPRSQSPARGNGGIKVVNESQNHLPQQQVPSLNSTTLRKAEHSPLRRTPLDKIDMNSLPIQPLANKPAINNSLSKAQHKNKDSDDGLGAGKKHVNPASQSKCAETSTVKLASHGTHRRTNSRGSEGNEIAKINSSIVSNTLSAAATQQSTQNKGEQQSAADNAVVTPVIVCGADSLKLPQTFTRSRSSRRSRDLDKNDEALLTATTTSNYNSLLLQDIQNFLQSSDNNANANANANANTNANICTPFTLPPCLSKACSILEAVADLNSSTSSNLSAGAFADDKHKSAISSNPSNRGDNSDFCFLANPAGKKRLVQEEARDSLVVESEVNVGDDLMAPTIHKYVTLRKKGIDDEGQESSGSNSFVGNQCNNWVPSCSWEPKSADSKDCFTSSRSKTSGKEGSDRRDVEKARNNEESHRKTSKIKREASNKQQNGTKNARSGGAGKGRLHGVANPVATISAST